VTADIIFLAGADPSASHPVLGMAIRRALKRGAEIISVNSSPVDLLRPTDLWLDSRRGTAGILYSAMLNYLLKAHPGNGLKPGTEALATSIAGATLSKAAEISGVDAAKIEMCAEKISSAKKVVAVYDLDETLEKSTDDLRALAQLLILTDHLWKKAQGLLLLQADCNSEGARLAGIANELHFDRFRGALVMFENPFGDYRAAKDLARIESLVVIDHFLTETGRVAEVVLPAATLAESDGTVVSFDGRFGAVERASKPAPGCSTAEVLAKLCQAFGGAIQSLEPQAIRADLANELGIPAADLEVARSAGSVLQVRPAMKSVLTSLRMDATASLANVFPYASLDAILDKKLSELNVH
jgi:predicted molibdopterin-dependent oxidoreductase YjgC